MQQFFLFSFQNFNKVLVKKKKKQNQKAEKKQGEF